MAGNIFQNDVNSPMKSQRAYGWDRNSNPDLATGTRMSPGSSSENGLLQTSTNITMQISGVPIGMVQSLSISESRSINKLQAIGQEGIVQAVPSNTQGGQLSISRIALYNSKFAEVVGVTDVGVFVTLRNQRVPFEISVKTPTSPTTFETTTYCDCWISSYSKSYAVSSITVAENLTVQYSDVE